MLWPTHTGDVLGERTRRPDMFQTGGCCGKGMPRRSILGIYRRGATQICLRDLRQYEKRAMTSGPRLSNQDSLGATLFEGAWQAHKPPVLSGYRRQAGEATSAIRAVQSGERQGKGGFVTQIGRIQGPIQGLWQFRRGYLLTHQQRPQERAPT